MRGKRPSNENDLQGNAWVFTGIGHARAVHQVILHTAGFIADTHDSSLDTSFFCKAIGADLPLGTNHGPRVRGECPASGGARGRA
jgi:hypothetical protein